MAWNSLFILRGTLFHRFSISNSELQTSIQGNANFTLPLSHPIVQTSLRPPQIFPAMPTTSIPSIDLSLFTHGTPSQRCSVIAAFDHAARTVGFLQLHSHPIPPPTLSAVLSAAATFFALPQNQKLASSPSTPAQNRGYSPPSSESLALSLSTSQPSPPDTFEAFNVGPEPVDYADPFFAAERHRFFAPNIWPTTPAPLRPATNAYFAHAHAVALIVTQIIGEALGTDFSPITDRSTTTMRVINYTPANDGPSNGETGAKRMGAHT